MDIQINIYLKKSVNFASFPEESSVSSAEGCHGNEPARPIERLGFLAENCAFVTNRT
jgi:hypothetical protein